jgi:hypothetical protein
MIEIEFPALSKQCLNRRIPTRQQLEEQIKHIVEQRNKQQIKIDWQFSIGSARRKLNNRYAIVNTSNSHLSQITY